MSQTISGYFTKEIVLGDGGAYRSPTTISATVNAQGRNDLLIVNAWNVTLTGAILAPANAGNLVEADGYVSFDNLGRIAGGGSGINLYQGGAISNAGRISGYRYAIDAYAGGQNSAATPFFRVTNSGYLGATGAAGHGIFGGPGLVSNTGTIFGGEFGILDVSTVVNDGTVQATDFGVGFAPGGTLENQKDGIITGGLFAVYGSRGVSTTIANAGYILAGNDAGVQLGYGYAGNTGTIASDIGPGVYFSGAASLNNAGLIENEEFGGVGVSLAAGGAVTNTGTITGSTGMVADGGTITNGGLIEGAGRNGNGNGGSGVNATAVQFTGAGTFVETGAGVVLGSVIGDGGTLVLEGGSLAQVSGFAADVFAGPEATLVTDLAGLGVVSGFAGDDALLLSGPSADSGSFYGHALTLSTGEVVEFAGVYGVHQLKVTPDPADGTDISAACFLAGTRIAAARGEVPVEELAEGELVRTVHAGIRAVKWVGRRVYEAPFCNNAAVLPVRIAAGALWPGVPVRDLWVSPGHALWVGGALVPAGRLVNGTSIAQEVSAARVAYFHVELEGHELLLAEGCPAESLLAEGFLGLFQNAPAEVSAGWGLPRMEAGFGLLARQTRLGVAAGLGCGGLRGFVDVMGPGLVAGWAQDAGAPEAPVVLDVLRGGRRVARVLANEYRADLRRAGMGSGNHGFSVTLPEGAVVDAVVRARDGAVLGLSRECAAAVA